MYEFGSTFFERIDSILELQKISKIQFYSDLEITRGNVSKWKKGSIPSGSTLIQISHYLDVSPIWLYTGQDFQTSYENDSPAQIVNRIKLKLEELTNLRQYTNDVDRFYMPLHGCIKPYELTKWFYGVQIPSVQKLNAISSNLHVSLQFLITGSEIPPDSYDKYINSGNSELDEFHKYYNCLTDENRKIIHDVVESLFLKQDYFAKLKGLEEAKKLWERMNDPYKDSDKED